MKRVGRHAGALALAWCTACGAPTRESASPAGAGDSNSRDWGPASIEATRQQAFAAAARVDRRLARRFGLRAQGVALLFPENRAPAELSALFDFDARAKVIAEQRARVRSDPALSRLFAEESARVDEERDLPRSASAIVRTLALDLPIDDTREEDVRSEDEALVATLDRLRGTLRDGSLGPLQLAELDDALDPFEKRTTRLVATPGAVARLRVTLTSLKSAPKESIAPWDATRPRLEVFVGNLPSAADLARAFDTSRAALAPRLAAIVPKERSDRERLVSAAAEMLLSSSSTCPDARLGEVQAPIERRGLCVLLEALAKNDPVALLAADLALDLARWAVAVHQARVDVAAAFANKHAHVNVDEVDGAHLFRFALAHPIEAISLGLAAAIVARDPVKMAAAWRAKGPIRPDEARSVLDPGLM